MMEKIYFSEFCLPQQQALSHIQHSLKAVDSMYNSSKMADLLTFDPTGCGTRLPLAGEVAHQIAVSDKLDLT